MRNKLINAATEYDRKQSTKRGYNHYALPQYFAAVDDAVSQIDKGKPVRGELLRCFTGRLLDTLLRSVGESKSTHDEQRSGRWHR